MAWISLTVQQQAVALQRLRGRHSPTAQYSSRFRDPHLNLVRNFITHRVVKLSQVMNFTAQQSPTASRRQLFCSKANSLRGCRATTKCRHKPLVNCVLWRSCDTRPVRMTDRVDALRMTEEKAHEELGFPASETPTPPADGASAGGSDGTSSPSQSIPSRAALVPPKEHYCIQVKQKTCIRGGYSTLRRTLDRKQNFVESVSVGS